MSRWTVKTDYSLSNDVRTKRWLRCCVKVISRETKHLLSDCFVNAEKYLDRSFDLWTEGSDVRTQGQSPTIFQDWPSNWLIRALLQSMTTT